MFRRHGYEETDAFIRARVLYYMQIGYYALRVEETMAKRLSYVPAYIRSFTGKEAPARELKRFRAFVLQHEDGGGANKTRRSHGGD